MYIPLILKFNIKICGHAYVTTDICTHLYAYTADFDCYNQLVSIFAGSSDSISSSEVLSLTVIIIIAAAVGSFFMLVICCCIVIVVYRRRKKHKLAKM